MKAWIGTFTGSGSKGIYLLETEDMHLSAHVRETCVNPSYIIISPDQRFLYAVRETSTYRGHDGGAVACYAINNDRLTFVNEQLIAGGSPCHLVCDQAMHYLVCSNFGGGFASVFALNADGSIGGLSRTLRQEAAGQTAHVHQAVLTPDEHLLAVTDLGLDRIDFYEFNSDSGVGTHCFTLNCPEGSGPRHMVFGHHDCFYVACELSNEVLACRIRPDGPPRMVSRLSTLQTPGTTSYCGAICLTPDGSLLVSNRGEDTLALFTLLADGRPALRQHISCGGAFPRDMAFSPDGNLLLCANQKSDSLSLLTYHQGVLAGTDRQLSVPQPCCVAWARS